MLFRRFGIVTLSLMLTGILLAQAVETHHRSDDSISLESRLKQWERFEEDRTCKQKPELEPCLKASTALHAA